MAGEPRFGGHVAFEERIGESEYSGDPHGCGRHRRRESPFPREKSNGPTCSTSDREAWFRPGWNGAIKQPRNGLHRRTRESSKMRTRRPSLVFAVLGASAIGFAAVHDGKPGESVHPLDHVHVGAHSCKPAAPLTLTITRSSVSQGMVRFDYSASSSISATFVETALELPTNATLVEHRRVARGLNANEAVTGQGSVRLAAGARGAKIRVRGTIEFMGSDEHGDSQVETAVTTVDLLVGDIEESTRAIDLPRITSGSEPSLEIPAVRTGGSSR